MKIPAKPRFSLHADLLLGLLRLADAFSIGLGGLIASSLAEATTGSASLQPLAVAFVAIAVAILLPSGDYTSTARALAPSSLVRLFSGLALVAAFIGLFLLLGGPANRPTPSWLMLWLICSGFTLAVVRVVCRPLVARWYRAGRLGSRVAIFGAGADGTRVIEKIASSNDPTIHVIAVLDDRTRRIPKQIRGVPVFGGVSLLDETLKQLECDDLIIALPLSAQKRIQEICDSLKHLPISVRLAASELTATPRDRNRLAATPVINLLDRPLSDWQGLRKRLFDISASTVFLVLLAPVIGLIAAAIKLDSRGPVLFRQRREGLANTDIEIFKFRTMYSEQCDPMCLRQSSDSDTRVTRVGRFLRRTGLDELPQLLNVLLGDMSLVGPRPHAVEMRTLGYRSTEIFSAYRRRQSIRPGITGWAQVHGNRGPVESPTVLQERVAHDLYYIEHWSVLLDLKIVLVTAAHLLRDMLRQCSRPRTTGVRVVGSRSRASNTNFANNGTIRQHSEISAAAVGNADD